MSGAVCEGHGPARAGRWSQTKQGLEDPAQGTGLSLKDIGHHGRLRSGAPWYNLLSRRFSLAGMCRTDGGEVRVLPSGFFHLRLPRRRPITQRGSKRGFHGEVSPSWLPCHPPSPPFLAKPTISKEMLRGSSGWCRGTPKGVRSVPFSYLSAMWPVPGYPRGALNPFTTWDENSLPGRSGPSRSGQPGGSAAGPSPTHPCGARASPAGRRPGQPSLPCPRLPGRHPPRQLRPASQYPPPDTPAPLPQAPTGASAGAHAETRPSQSFPASQDCAWRA